jgi:argininosuccinate lyase
MKSTSDVIDPHEFVPWELWKSVDAFLGAIKIMTGVLGTIKVKRENMLADVERTWVFASDLAGMIVRRKDLPFRTAHQIVAIAVREAVDEGKKPMTITSQMIDRAAIEYSGHPLGLGEDNIRQVLDARNRIEARTLIGGVAPREVGKQILEAQRALVRDLAYLKKLQGILETRNKTLESASDEIVSSNQK